MSFGKYTHARLLSPLAALLWITVVVGFAGTAQAATTSHPADPQAADHAQTSSSSGQADTHAQADAQGQADTHAQAAASTQASAGATASAAAHTGSPSPSAHADHGATTGALTQPQPLSTADQNAGGANGQCPGGPYCSTRDGSPSLNGNGGGVAVGKPCAGCVGKADNKNPHGQMPNGSDANAGYECDTNHGIGRSNPAHTGCQPPTQPGCVPSASNDYCGQPQPGCVPSASNDYCGQPQPGCVPSASNNYCGQPQPGCVPSASNNNCGQPTPGCVPSPTVTCGETPPVVSPPVVSPPVVSPPSVSAPGGGTVTVQAAGPVPGSSVPPTVRTGLPNTGAPAGLVGDAALAVLVMLAGAALVATTRRSATVS